MSKHTQGSLRILNLATDPGHILIGDASGYPIARIPFPLDLEYQAIAERIIRTWNCHDDLVAALQAFVDYHEGDFPYEPEEGEEEPVDGRSPEMTQALSAIAKAKESPCPHT